MMNNQYSLALTVTYIPYIITKLQTLYQKFSPNLMLPTMLTLWRTITTLQGLFPAIT
ncbi:hypothetical protein J132_08101 [Termitomyces sp. J132]|nr:hypothetical protein J132_08101 [Termitomyces sp. J132]